MAAISGNGPPEYTVSVDVFSFGCVIIHLDTHVWPSPIPVPKGQFISEIERRNKYISEMGNQFLVTLVKRCLQEPSSGTERPSSTTLVNLLQEKALKGQFINNV